MADLKLMRRGVILAKVESTYGQDASPTNVDGVLCSVPMVSFQANRAERDFMRGSISPYGFAVGAIQQTLQFTTELKGPNDSSNPDTPTHIDALMRACAMEAYNVVVVPVSGVTGTFEEGETVTGGTSTKSGVFLRLVDDKMHLKDVTGGFSDGETFTGGSSGATATVGSNANADKRREYSPMSDPNTMESVTLYYYLDGILHKMVGARGSFAVNFNVNGFPSITFNMTGIFVDPSDSSNPTNVTFLDHFPPRCLDANLTVGGYLLSGVETVDWNMANNVVPRPGINSQTGLTGVVVVTRNPTFNTVCDLADLATFNPFSTFKNGSKVMVWSEIGTLGNRAAIYCPEVQLEAPGYTDRQGVASYTLSGTCTGEDDELILQTG